MNETIEAIVNDAVERAMAFSPGDQSFIYSEVRTACRIYRIRR